MKRANLLIGLALIIALLLLLVDASLLMSNDGTLEDRIKRYDDIRQTFLEYEAKEQFGGMMSLSDSELIANEHIMTAKRAEYDKAFVGADNFKPSKHFFTVYKQIAETPLFQLLQDMPKGAALHVHDVAICSVDRLMTFTHWEHLWACTNGEEFEAFRFAREQPDSNVTCQWQLMKQLFQDDLNVEKRLRAQLTLYPLEHFSDGYDAWRVFAKIFRLVYGLLTYEPVWAKYLEYALSEFYADGVQYMEIRSTLPVIYDLDETNYTVVDTVSSWEKVTTDFCKEHRDFIGVKIIYSPRRKVDDGVFDGYLETALLLKTTFPDFIAGFDLVGHEDAGRPLYDFAHKLLAVNDKLDFYFHAGETNWYGSSSDENLLDALMLGTKRIGHGYALVKHPALLALAKQQRIAIEVNPISNQVLQHVSDLRNHPCAIFFAGNYPVVISSDDSAYWRAKPLTHDFYAAFVGIASKNANLGLLKQLARNSIVYSSLDAERKFDAIGMWESQWDAWIRRIAGLATDNEK